MKMNSNLCNAAFLSTLISLAACTGGTEKNEETQSEQVKAETTATPVTIKEWPVPWEDTRPRDPYVDQEGRTWFCGQKGNYIAYLDPSSGEFKRYELAEGTHPHNLIVDSEGFVWYAGNQNAHIGKLDPSNGDITQFPMPNPDARDPHTLVFNKEGNIWFTLQMSNFIGHLNTKTGEVQLVEVPTSGARPYGIKLDQNEQPWIVLFGTNKLATVDPNSFELTEIELPNTDARPRRMEITPDGSIYYVDYSRGYLGRYIPASQTFKEWALPSGEDAAPYGTAMDGQGRIWLAESGVNPNQLVGFNPAEEEFFSITEVPSGGGTIRYMYFHPPTQEIWFGTDTNNIGRASITEQPENQASL